jgi:hypothetical protein
MMQRTLVFAIVLLSLGCESSQQPPRAPPSNGNPFPVPPMSDAGPGPGADAALPEAEGIRATKSLLERVRAELA